MIALLFSPALAAHEMRPAALNIVEISPTRYFASWKVPAKYNERLALEVLIDDLPAFEVTEASFIGEAYLETGHFERSHGLIGATVHIQGLDATFTDVLLRLERLDGSVFTHRLSPENPSYHFDQHASKSVAETYTFYGLQHILAGIDHLLFIACIALIAGFTRRLLWAITGFTVAHSVTLGLAALDSIRLPIPAVEAVIALSIVFLATEIVKANHDSLSYRYPVIVSVGFGLLHGFGFAAVLADIGLPQMEKLSALLFFNLGVEIGQLLFIAALFLSLRLCAGFRLCMASGISQKFANLTRQKWQKRISYIIGSVAFMWMIERIFLF